jgi:hypothetical protein
MHIQTEHTTVPFFYNPSATKQQQQKRNECNFFKCKDPENLISFQIIPPRTETTIRLPAVGKNGNKICPKIKISDTLVIPSAIVRLHNNWFTTTALNTSDKQQKIFINNPLYLEDFDIQNSESISVNNHNLSFENQFKTSTFRK